ncbi:putative phytosulfokine [Helianthus annuus]|nr:putative phytosulfokine [Helianthus annuus]
MYYGITVFTPHLLVYLNPHIHLSFRTTTQFIFSYSNSRTMSRTIILFFLLALFSMSSSEARLVPALSEAVTSTISTATQKGAVVEDSCNGIATDECLERRTLVAHLDYIYTNDKKP